MSIKIKYTYLFDAIICSISLMVFSFFVQSDFPLKLLSISALLVPAYIFGKNLQTVSDLQKITGVMSFNRGLLIYCSAGLFLGILLTMFYRWYLGLSLLPLSFHYFVFIAALIGSTEEVIFRGFIQGFVKNFSTPFSIFFSTISHTGYKCFLFLSPFATSGVDVINLAFWTFLFGIVFGTIRHYAKSIFPSLIAHAVFDILVYAEYSNAPWWVW
jgi:membrane protease YdiL (CAAX protease family)